MYRFLPVIFVAAIIVGAIFYLESLKPSAKKSQPTAGGIRSVAIVGDNQNKPTAPELADIAGYINTNGITVGELIGQKVILVDFWTYSCINCQRTTPYLNAWYDKYQDDGLEIIGVHTPEFEFEKNRDNVQKAVEKYGIRYPVVQDNNYATWTNYRNRYWPRKYLINIDGQIVYDHIGEGGYEETEKKIQELLQERRAQLGLGGKIEHSLSADPAPGIRVSTSPEIYFGSDRNEYLGNGEAFKAGTRQFTLPVRTESGRLYLGGEWEIRQEYVQNRSSGARVQYGFRAKEIYVVGSSARPAVIRVLKDGRPLGIEAGEDVVNSATGTHFSIHEDRLYKIFKSDQTTSGTLELIIEDPEVKIFTFTFG